MKKFYLLAVALVLITAAQVFGGVVPAPWPFYEGAEQTDARMIYVGGSESGGKLAVDCHAYFSLARDDNNVVQNWCNLGTFKWTFGFFSFDGPKSEYPLAESDVSGSKALTFDGGDKLRMILEPGQGFTLPSEITDGVLSVEMWVLNPQAQADEVLIRFEDGSNVDLTAGQFNMSGSTSWQHLVAVSNGSQTAFYKNGSLVGTQAGSLSFSDTAVINLGAQSFSGSMAAVRIHTEEMNTTDISHNYAGGVGLGTYCFYVIHRDYRTSCTDESGDENIAYGDPTGCNQLNWRESTHFRSLWISDPDPAHEIPIATRIETIQLVDLERYYAFFNEKTGKHLPHVSVHEHLRGDGRKYKWVVGNGHGDWSGWSQDHGLGWGSSFWGYASFHEYTHGTDNHQMGALTSQWWEAHANWSPEWGGDVETNPVFACPKGAHIYPVWGGDYYHDFLIFEHCIDTPELGGIFATRIWNYRPNVPDFDRVYPPKVMELCDPSPETPFSQEWVKVAAKNITWDYPRHPEYASYWATVDHQAHIHYTLLEEVPYLASGWYEPPKWRAPHQLGYNICPLKVNTGTVTADIDGHIDSARGSAWSAMFVAVDYLHQRHTGKFQCAFRRR